ncbi:MAG: ABC transporter permease [Candidatus Nanopelagicales bacterium]
MSTSASVRPPAAAPAWPSTTGLVVRQTRHDLVGIRRTPVVLFFALAFPVGFFILLASVIGNETIDSRSGIRYAQFLAPAFAAFGIAMATFAFLAIGLAEIRFNGVLRRLSGTPLPAWVLLAGRVLAGTVLAFGSVLLLVAVGMAFYDVQMVWRTLPAVIVTVLVAAMSFSALGLAVAAWAPSMQAATALANGIVITLAFISDLFIVGTLPGWLDTLGWVFPLKHLVNALGDEFNPMLDGSGFYPGHLAVIAAWGVAGAVLAWWGVRRAATGAGGGAADLGTAPASASGRSARSATRDGTPRHTGRVPVGGLVLDQVRHANSGIWRDWSAVFFGVGFPLLLAVLLTTVFGGKEAETDEGVRLGQLFAATMTMYGAAVISYVTLPEGLAEMRQAGVLRRWSGTPLPSWALLAGRAVSAVWVALVAMALVYAAMVPVFGVVIPPTWIVGVAILVVSTLSFAALGMAVVSLVRSTQAVLAVCLGSLITLAFFSDIFIIGAPFPDLLNTVSWILPLRPAVNSLVDAMAADAAFPALNPGWMATVIAWGIAGVVVTMLRSRASRGTD